MEKYFILAIVDKRRQKIVNSTVAISMHFLIVTISTITFVIQIPEFKKKIL